MPIDGREEACAGPQTAALVAVGVGFLVVSSAGLFFRDAGWAAAIYALFLASSYAAPALLVTLLLARLGPAAGVTARLLASGAASLAALLLFIDARLHATLGVHLHDSVVTGLWGRGRLNDTLHVTWGEVSSALAALVAISAAQFLAGAVLSRRIPARYLRGWAAWGFPVAALIVAIGAGACLARLPADDRVTNALPGYRWLFPRPSDSGAKGYRLAYPRPGTPLPAFTRKPNYLLLVIETLREDRLAPGTMPELWTLSEGERCHRSQAHYASSHSTDHCLFSILFGLHSFHYQVLGKRNVPNYFFQALAANGYRLVGASSAPLSNWGELSYVTEQFSSFYEAKGAGPVERDRDLVRFAADFLERAEGGPYFLFVFFDATHHKYYFPPEFTRRRPFLPEDHSLITAKVDDPEVRRQFINRYDNAVAFVDHEASAFLRAFLARQTGDYIVAVTGDHGEELWDFGLLGHASVGFTNPRVRVPLVLCQSGERARSIPLSSHVDIVPTFVDFGMPSPPVPAGLFSSGVSLLAPPDPSRMVLSLAIDFPAKNRELLVVSADRKFLAFKEPVGQKSFRFTAALDAQDRPVLADPGDMADAAHFLERTYWAFFDRARQ